MCLLLNYIQESLHRGELQLPWLPLSPPGSPSPFGAAASPRSCHHDPQRPPCTVQRSLGFTQRCVPGLSQPWHYPACFSLAGRPRNVPSDRPIRFPAALVLLVRFPFSALPRTGLFALSHSVGQQTFMEPHGRIDGAQALEPDAGGTRMQHSHPLFQELTCAAPGT